MKSLEQRVWKLYQSCSYEHGGDITDLIVASGIAKDFGHGWEQIAPSEKWEEMIESLAVGAANAEAEAEAEEEVND